MMVIRLVDASNLCVSSQDILMVAKMKCITLITIYQNNTKFHV